MILKWTLLGIPVAGFFAAGILAGQAEPGTAAQTPPAARSDAKPAGADQAAALRLAKSRTVDRDEKAGEEPAPDEVREEKKGTKLVIDGEEIAREVEETVSDAVSDTVEALEDIEADIRVELDGKKLDALSKEYRETLDDVRERLRGVGERLAEHAAEVEVRVTRAGEAAVEAAKEAGEALRETRVIIVRDGEDAQIEIEKDEEGRTVVVIEGGDVKVITREKNGETGKPAPE